MAVTGAMIVDRLRAKGLTVTLNPSTDGLDVQPRELRTPEMRAYVKGHREVIIAYLKGEEAVPTPPERTPQQQLQDQARGVVARMIDPPTGKRPYQRRPTAFDKRVDRQLDAVVGSDPIVLPVASGPPDHYFKVPNILVDRLIQDHHLPPSTVVVLLYLCRNIHGWNRRSSDQAITVVRMHKDLRMSEPTIIKALRLLEQAGLIQRQFAPGGKAKKGDPFRVPSLIVITLPKE